MNIALYDKIKRESIVIRDVVEISDNKIGGNAVWYLVKSGEVNGIAYPKREFSFIAAADPK